MWKYFSEPELIEFFSFVSIYFYLFLDVIMPKYISMLIIDETKNIKYLTAIQKYFHFHGNDNNKHTNKHKL